MDSPWKLVAMFLMGCSGVLYIMEFILARPPQGSIVMALWAIVSVGFAIVSHLEWEYEDEEEEKEDTQHFDPAEALLLKTEK